jgi:predicted dehydrogenase
MSAWPAIPFGHTEYRKAFADADVYGIRPDPARAAKKPLRLGIAGCGGVAQAKWLPAIRYLQTRSEPLAIAGVADPDESARAKMALLSGTPGFASVETLLAKARPDLLLVLTADAAHGATARAAIAAGVAVLCEKPLCRTEDEARGLCAFAEGKGVLLASVANKRFSPPYALARRLVGEGRLNGPPRVFAGKFTLGYPYVDLLEGGTIHLLDLALWFMGPVASVQALGTFGEGGRLESAVAGLAFHSGAIGSIVTSAAAMSFKPWERVEVIGDHAMLAVEDQLALTLFDDENGPAKTWQPTIPNTLMMDEQFGGYAGLLEHVADALRGLVALAATGRDGAAAVALVAAIHEAIRRGAPVDLELPAEQRAWPVESRE